MTGGVDRLAGAAVMLGIITGWWALFLGAVRLYENLAHAYKLRKRRKRKL